MGLFSDTLEDQRERGFDLPLPIYSAQERLPNYAPGPQVTLYPCPACELVFTSQDRLDRHLFAVHAGETFYVRVNGAVVPDTCFVDGALASLEVVVLGGEALGLAAVGSDGTDAALVIDPGQRCDLLGSLGLAPSFHGEIDLLGQVGAHRRRYSIHVQRVPDFSAGDLDRVVELAQEPLADGLAPSVNLLRQRRSRERPGSLEERYVDGFAEYLLGCQFEVDLDFGHARDRYEQAFGRLRVFRTSLATSAMGILEFRAIAVRRLRGRGPTSRLWQSALFLESPEPSELPGSVASTHDRGIWIDAYQEGLLNGIGAYADGDFDRATEIALALPQSLLDGPGNRRKRQLLVARASLRAGNTEAARAAYAELKEDVVFGDEARVYLDAP